MNLDDARYGSHQLEVYCNYLDTTLLCRSEPGEEKNGHFERERERERCNGVLFGNMESL